MRLRQQLSQLAVLLVICTRVNAQNFAVAERREVVDSTAAQVERIYVDPDTARMIAARLRAQLRAGAYDTITDRTQFAQALTNDLRFVNHDLHLSSAFAPPMSNQGAFRSPTAFLEVSGHFALGRLDVLPGNIGYLEINGFSGDPAARNAIVGALKYLETTDAIIFDVRRNRGGDAGLVNFLISHFTGPDTVASVAVKTRRAGGSYTRYTLAAVPGPRRPTVPLYLLTGRGTASAGEDFAFVLQNMRRATLVGDRTAGAGHNVTFVSSGHGFRTGISFSRVSDPRTGREWEQVGVQPDAKVDVGTALDVAQSLALDALSHTTSAVPRDQLVLIRQGIEARLHPQASPPTTAAITPEDLRQRLFLIADDSMMGRESGSLGDYKTAEYVAAEFRRLGLEPAGDNGTYFQTVPFWTAAADPASSLRTARDTFRVGRDFVPVSLRAAARPLEGSRAIYGGVLSDTSTWIRPEDAAGKIVVLDLPAGSPGQAVPAVSLRWRTADAVAVVALGVVGEEIAAMFREGVPIADTTRNPNGMPTLWITRRVATALLGGDPRTMKSGTVGAAVHGWFVVARTPVPYPARNVIGILRGSDPALRNEYVSLTAHNDHVGFDHTPVDHDSLRAFNRVMRPMGADSPPREPTAREWTAIRTILDSLRRVNRPRLDSIRNGADDDGSGTVAILEIAEAMAKGAARPKRSILFVSHTGEEAGLLGSQWFTNHPTVPIDSIVAEIDEDGIGRGTSSDFPRNSGTGAGSATYLEVVGAKRLSREFGDSLEAVNAREPLPFVFDYTYDTPGHPFQYYCRADHYNYARFGVPSVTIARGEHLDYHQVTDEAQYISYPDLARVAHMVYSAAMAIANMSHPPKLDGPKPTNPNVFCRQ